MMRSQGKAYTSAGYRQGRDASREQELYIARDVPGSARDNLRDQNRRGYQGDSPKPALQRQGQQRKTAAQTKAPEGLLDILIREYRQDRAAAFLCIVLGIMVLVLGAVWTGQARRNREERAAIEAFRAQTIQFERENDRLRQEIERAKSGEAIRNQAMNNLGMLRPERAETQEIFIRLPEEASDLAAPQAEDTSFEFLDVLLGILHLFHVGN